MPSFGDANNVMLGGVQAHRVYLGAVKVWPLPVAPGARQLVYSISETMTDLQPLSDATISGGVAVLLVPTDGVTAVDFYIDGVFERREQTSPLSLKGDVDGKTANLLDTAAMTNGTHTVDADVTTNAGVQRFTATFTVSNTNNTGQIPEPPTGVKATAGDLFIDLDWLTVTNATAYRVYRDGIAVQDGLTASEWRDTTVVAGTSYTYTVTAYNIDGESGPSSPVSATPTGIVASPKLSWHPPSGTTWVEKTVPSSGGTLTLSDNTNYRLVAPNIIDGTHVKIVLGSNTNVVWIGGHIRKGGAFDPMQKSTYDTQRRGIRISDGGNAAASGTVHIEGIKFEGYFSDPIQIAIRAANDVKVQIQNMDMRQAFAWGINDKNSDQDLHGDVIQCWGGPTTLLVDGLVALHACYQGFYWDPGDGRALPTGTRSPWTVRRVYIKGDDSVPGSSSEAYLLCNRRPTYTSIVNDRVYWEPTANNYYDVTDGFGQWPAEGLTKGAPPGGDFDISNPGLTYVSPGYIS